MMEEKRLHRDSQGEFLVLAASLEDTGINTGNAKAKTLDAATGKLLGNRKSAPPKPCELDNQGSNAKEVPAMRPTAAFDAALKPGGA